MRYTINYQLCTPESYRSGEDTRSAASALDMPEILTDQAEMVPAQGDLVTLGHLFEGQRKYLTGRVVSRHFNYIDANSRDTENRQCEVSIVIEQNYIAV